MGCREAPGASGKQCCALQAGSSEAGGHLACCLLPGPRWAPPYYRDRKGQPTLGSQETGAKACYPGKDGKALTAVFPGKSLPLSLSFPKVWPSGLGHLLAAAASTIPRGPGQRAAMPLPHSVHTHHSGCRPAGHRRRAGGATLPMAGSCRAGCPSTGHRNLEPAATLRSQERSLGRPGQAGAGWPSAGALSPPGFSETFYVLDTGPSSGARAGSEPQLQA